MRIPGISSLKKVFNKELMSYDKLQRATQD